MRDSICKKLGIKHVPVICNPYIIEHGMYCEELLQKATGESVINSTLREGLVFKALDRMESFKTVSNEYLMSK